MQTYQCGVKMIVDKYKFDEITEMLDRQKVLSVDTETTGLYPYKDDKLFSIIIGTHHDGYYFNFSNTYTSSGRFVLDTSHYFTLKNIFANPKRIWFMHNAKFDMAFLAKMRFDVGGTIHDTKAIERITFNEFQSYKLADCAKRIGLKKDDSVEEHIKTHKLYTQKKLAHKKSKVKFLHYDQVPWDLITKYGVQDAKITYTLGETQIGKIRCISKAAKITQTPIIKLYATETKLTRTVYEMERRGVKIDKEYCVQASAYEEEEMQKEQVKFWDLTSLEYKDSPKLFKEVFKDCDVKARTPTGKISFDKDSLKEINNPRSRCILKIRKHKSNCEYYRSFLYFCDRDGILHTNFKPDGTGTGRFSCTDPNLQNLTKNESIEEDEEEDKEFWVRAAIIPREGYIFAMFDYKSMEYLMMLDIANEEDLIKKVKGGLDVHQATADLAGITRKQAKTVNFAILYGAGIKKLAGMLGVPESEARRIKEALFKAAPRVRKFISDTISDAEDYKRIVNWAGRISHFPDHNFAYKAPNYLIQGGCADVIKIAMNNIADYLEDFKSKMILTIHDEIVVEVHKSESLVIPEIKKIMEAAYKGRNLALTCSVETSDKSLAHRLAYVSGANQTDQRQVSTSR